MKIAAVTLASAFSVGLATLSGCAHLVQFTGAVPDAAADEAFARELDRLDKGVRACYGKVIVTDEVPLELAVNEQGAPIAARTAGPLFGSTLGGCLESVAFQANLGPGTTRRLGRAVARLRPVASAEGLVAPAPAPGAPKL